MAVWGWQEGQLRVRQLTRQATRGPITHVTHQLVSGEDEDVLHGA
jgi:hypothetical protein